MKRLILPIVWVLAGGLAPAQIGQIVSDPEPLNTNAFTDTDDDSAVSLACGATRCVAAWLASPAVHAVFP